LNSLHYYKPLSKFGSYDNGIIPSYIVSKNKNSLLRIGVLLKHNFGEEYPINFYENTPSTKYDHFEVLDSTYNDVVEIHDGNIIIFLAKEQGLIQFIDKNAQDTFKLTKYFVK
jgi:hypothetical protein